MIVRVRRRVARLVAVALLGVPGAWAVAQAPEREPAPTLEFVDAFVREGGGMSRIVGVVRNDADYAMESVRITGILYDRNGSPVSMGLDRTTLDVLLPGEWSPFAVTVLEEAPFGRFDYHADWTRARSEAVRSARVVEHRGRQRSESFVITGRVRNDGARPLERVQVIAAAYDAQGGLTEVGSTYTGRDVLRPGGASSFSLTIRNGAWPVARYELIVQARRR